MKEAETNMDYKTDNIIQERIPTNVNFAQWWQLRIKIKDLRLRSRFGYGKRFSVLLSVI